MTIENVTYHFALGHFCAGCPLSIVQHKGCPMVVTKNTPQEIMNKPKDKLQPVTEVKLIKQNV